MSAAKKKLPPLPLILFCTAVYDGASVTIYSDPTSKWGGAVSKTNMIRMACPPEILEDVFVWILIQMERKRIGLPYLEPWEMEILPQPHTL